MRSRILAVFAFALCASFSFAAGSATQPTICNRACWSARSATSYTYMSALNRAVIHHTASAGDYNTTSRSTSAAKVRAIQNYHMDTNGWSDIGYNFLTDKLGNNFEGRVNSMTKYTKGAHDAVNYNSFGFNIMGYYHSPYNNAPTTAGLNAQAALIAWRMPNPFTGYGSGTYNGKTVGYICGHRNANPTACPGDLYYAYIGTNFSGGWMRNAVNARINPAPPAEVIVDDSGSNFIASANWWTSSYSPGYYGTGYHCRSTEAISDQAAWNVNIPSTGTYKVYARWTAGTNRAASASYSVIHNGGTTNVAVNQQANNGTWVLLGTFGFNSGASQKIKLSCWTTAGFVVVADAVKFVKQ